MRNPACCSFRSNDTRQETPKSGRKVEKSSDKLIKVNNENEQGYFSDVSDLEDDIKKVRKHLIEKLYLAKL